MKEREYKEFVASYEEFGGWQDETGLITLCGRLNARGVQRVLKIGNAGIVLQYWSWERGELLSVQEGEHWPVERIEQAVRALLGIGIVEGGQ